MSESKPNPYPNFDWTLADKYQLPPCYQSLTQYVDSFSERPIIGSATVMSLVESLAVSEAVTHVNHNFGQLGTSISESDKQQLAVRVAYGALVNKELAATLFGQPATAEPDIALASLIHLRQHINQTEKVLAQAEQRGLIHDVEFTTSKQERSYVGILNFNREGTAVTSRQRAPGLKAAGRKAILAAAMQIQSLEASNVPQKVQLNRPQDPRNALDIWVSKQKQPKLVVTNRQIKSGYFESQATCLVGDTLQEFTAEGYGRQFTDITCMYKIIDAIIAQAEPTELVI